MYIIHNGNICELKKTGGGDGDGERKNEKGKKKTASFPDIEFE